MFNNLNGTNVSIASQTTKCFHKKHYLSPRVFHLRSEFIIFVV